MYTVFCLWYLLPHAAIQNIIFVQSALSIPYSIISSNITCFIVTFMIKTDSSSLHYNDQITLVIIFTNMPKVQIGTVIPRETTCTVKYINQHNYISQWSYSLTILTLSIPLSWQLEEKTSTNFTIGFNSTFSIPIVFSYILVQKIFISSHIYIVNSIPTQQKINYNFDNDLFDKISLSNSFLFFGLMQINYSIPLIIHKQIIIYQYLDKINHQPHTKLFYLSNDNHITKLSGASIRFDPSFSGCLSNNEYLTYLNPFVSAPQTCNPCDPTCLTCTSSQTDSTSTSSSYCLTCTTNRYLSPVPNAEYGNCLSINTTDINFTHCQFACLGFIVQLMQSSTQPTFLLTFSQVYVIFTSALSDNLVIAINNQQVNYTLKQESHGSYSINIPTQNFIPCQTQCLINFKFLHPQHITYKTKTLTSRQQNITMANFYIIQQKLPKQLHQYFSIVSILIIISSSNSQTSLIKMLFQLEQIIDAHKYLMFSIPVIFKQFVESLVYFRFMDITAVINFNINQFISSLCSDDLDNKGSSKIIYYQSGSNFYKNMVQVVVSVVLILCINLLIYLVIRAIPCELAWQLSQKIKIRAVITVSDIIESMVLPTSLFTIFQFSYIVWVSKYIWVYMIAYLFMIPLLLFPFFIVAYIVYRMKSAQAIQIDIYQDLMNDCTIHGRIPYVFYLYNYLKKFVFGLILASNIPGIIQIVTLLVLNSVHLVLLCYMIKHKMFNSQLKVITRTLILLSIIGIQTLILVYNTVDNSIESKILIGVSCTYLAVVITGISMLEVVFKCIEILVQKIQNAKKKKLITDKNKDNQVNLQLNNNKEKKKNTVELEQDINVDSSSIQKQQQQQEIIPHHFFSIQPSNIQIILEKQHSTDFLRQTTISKQLPSNPLNYRRSKPYSRNPNPNKIQKISQKPEQKIQHNYHPTKQNPIKNQQTKSISSTLQTQKINKSIKRKRKKIAKMTKNNQQDQLIFKTSSNIKQFPENQSSMSDIATVSQSQQH